MAKSLEETVKSWMPDQKRLEREDVQKAMELAKTLLGRSGKMISSSKSWYTNKYKKNVVVFNGNLCSKELGKIWFGDLDLTLDSLAIKDLSKQLGVTLYVLRERDARFENENNPQFEEAVLSYSGDQIVVKEGSPIEVVLKGKYKGQVKLKV